MNVKSVLSKIVMSSWLLLGAAGVARANNGVPVQVWTPASFTQQEIDERVNVYGAPHKKMPSGRVILEHHPESRLEAEAQLQPRSGDIADIAKINARMQQDVADLAGFETLMGKGFQLVSVQGKPRDVLDIYLDSEDYLFANTGETLRIRSENGSARAFLNWKPGTARRFDDGVVYRIELGVGVELDPATRLPTARGMAFLKNALLRDNTLRELVEMHPGRKLEDFMIPAIKIDQVRTMYHINKGGTKMGEQSVDAVTPHDLRANKTGQPFPSVEIEGDHLNLTPSAAQLAKLAGTTWTGPHKAADTRNEALVTSEDVALVHHFTHVMSARHDLIPRGEAKYPASARQFGYVKSKPVLEKSPFPAKAK